MADDPTETTPPAPAPSPKPGEGAAAEQPKFTQADLDRILDQRFARERATFAAETNDLRAKAALVDELQAKVMTDAERAEAQRAREVESAREEAATAARTQAVAEVSTEHVGEYASALLIGRLRPEQAQAYASSINAAAFMGEGGRVDYAKLRTHLDTVFPATPGVTNFGQGRPEVPPAPEPANGLARMREAYANK